MVSLDKFTKIINSRGFVLQYFIDFMLTKIFLSSKKKPKQINKQKKLRV